MNKLKKNLLLISLILFTACGTEDNINQNLGFDMWDYMTSSRNYKVEYAIYEDNQFIDYYTESHTQYGDEYVRESKEGQTKIVLNSNNMLMIEPNNNKITIVRYVDVEDTGIFKASNINLCRFSKFHKKYETQKQIFDNVIQISCHYNSGLYQEFYYGFDEGIVSIYTEDNGAKSEYVKIDEQRI